MANLPVNNNLALQGETSNQVGGNHPFTLNGRQAEVGSSESPRSSWIQGKWTRFVLWVAKKCGIQLNRRIVTSHLKMLESKFQTSYLKLIQLILKEDKTLSTRNQADQLISSFEKRKQYLPSLSFSQALEKSTAALDLETDQVQSLGNWDLFLSSQKITPGASTPKGEETPLNGESFLELLADKTQASSSFINNDCLSKATFLQETLNTYFKTLDYGSACNDSGEKITSVFDFLQVIISKAYTKYCSL